MLNVFHFTKTILKICFQLVFSTFPWSVMRWPITSLQNQFGFTITKSSSLKYIISPTSCKNIVIATCGFNFDYPSIHKSHKIWLYLVNNVIFKCFHCHNGFVRMFSILFRQAMLHIHACLIYVGHLFEDWCTILHYLFHHLFCFWNPLSPFVKTTNTWDEKFNDLLVLDEMNCNQQWISLWISFGFFFCLVFFCEMDYIPKQNNKHFLVCSSPESWCHERLDTLLGLPNPEWRFFDLHHQQGHWFLSLMFVWPFHLGHYWSKSLEMFV
jgi:hypothetical protein